MPKETAGQEPQAPTSKPANVMFKISQRAKSELKIMCAELGYTQQEMLAAMVQVLTFEYKQQPDSVRSLVEEARARA